MDTIYGSLERRHKGLNATAEKFPNLYLDLHEYRFGSCPVDAGLKMGVDRPVECTSGRKWTDTKTKCLTPIGALKLIGPQGLRGGRMDRRSEARRGISLR
jgi:hypothetical protein